MLSSKIKKHQQSQVVDKLDEDGKLVRKSRREIIEADVSCKYTQLSNKEVFIGSKCIEIIKKLGLTPSSVQLKCLSETEFIYHTTVTQYLQKYFKKGMLSTKLTYMTSLSPKKRENCTTPYMLKYLAKCFSKVAKTIQAIDGEDVLVSEINIYSVDTDLSEIDTNLHYAEYWYGVSDVMEGDWPKYDVLPRFALCMGTFFQSNSEVERAFSVETDIRRDLRKIA